MKQLNLIGVDKYGYGQRNYAHNIDTFLSIPHTYSNYTHIYKNVYRENAINHVLVGIPSYKKTDILTVHDIAYNYPNFVKTRFFAFLLRETLKRADRLIVYSHFMKSEIERFYQKEDVAILSFGIDTTMFTDRLIEEARKKYYPEYDILIVSNLEQRKNILPYLEILSKTFLRVRLIGKPVDKKLSQSIMKIVKRSPNIFYSVSVSSIQTEYMKSKILLHPALYGGFEMPVAEASLMGLSTLLYDYPLNRELYGNAPNYLDYGEPTSEKLMESIFEAVENNTSKNMASIVRKNHDIRKTIKQYEKFYEGIL